MKTLTAAQASRALGISLDTLRRWDREGKIRVERDSANRRVVPASEVERLRAVEGQEGLTARNRFRGIVRSVGASEYGHSRRPPHSAPRTRWRVRIRQLPAE